MLGYEQGGLAALRVSDFMCDLPDVFANESKPTGKDEELLFMQETFWKRHDGHKIPVRVRIKQINVPGEPVFIIIARDLLMSFGSFHCLQSVD